MHQFFLRASSLFLFALLALVMAGCGSSHFRATGKITEKGAPIKLSDKGYIAMSFISTTDFEVYATQVNKQDGTFVIVGRDATGVPPGKYRVVVKVVDPYPSTKDKFQDKYSEKNTPLVREVNGKDEILIDLGS